MKLATALILLAAVRNVSAALRGHGDDWKNNDSESNGNPNGNDNGNGNGYRPGKPDVAPSPTEEGSNRPNGNAFGHSKHKSKGHILLGRGKGGHGKGIGKIDNTSLPAAQEGAKGILQSLSKNGNKDKFKATNSDVKHLRFTQEVNGIEVEGAALFVHTNDLGEVIGINGELVDGETVPSEPTLDAAVSIKEALIEALVPEAVHDQCDEPSLTVVRGLKDGKAYLSWTCTVRYDKVNEDGSVAPRKDKIFARATGEPGLIQSHPKIYMADPTPSVNTYNCNSSDICHLISDSSEKINTGNAAVDAAHNHAIDTFNYYSSKFGRNSIDGKGMTLKSLVDLSGSIDGIPLDNNAFWDGERMNYGAGKAGEVKALSLDLDVVAHELTHGVTENTSGLIYQNESGALNEAMSDIMAAFIEHENGADDESTWLVGEDVMDNGEKALRSMCNPAELGDYDYYPTRYKGIRDYGGVHWNSGIANLAACLLVKGDSHPRQKTSMVVTGVGFDVAADIFYNANVNCLTPSATFEQARFCTADIYGGAATESVHAAWDAVGVEDNRASFDTSLGAPKCSTPRQSCRSGDLLSGRSPSSESNAPNTLDGRQDGVSGTYLYDESVEAMEVSAVGGMGEHLKAGSKAVVKATVYAWGDGQDDIADFYYAENVNSPSWKFIGSTQAQKGGYHTLTSPEFTVPDSSLVAVRTVFRYKYSSSYDDADDLVFAVASANQRACVDLSTPFHADKTTGQMGINIKPTSDLSSIMAPRWSNVCSKIPAGECAWFHTGDEFVNVVIPGAHYADGGHGGTGGSFQWPEQQGFAYYVCRASGSSDCKTMGDLVLNKMCASHFDGNNALLVEEFEHRYSYGTGSGWWYDLYRGKVLWSACHDFGYPSGVALHVDKSSGQLAINVHPTSDRSSVLAPRWNDACSKINNGYIVWENQLNGDHHTCAWFYTGEDGSPWFEPEEAIGDYTPHAADWAGKGGSFNWPESQGFAYQVCRHTTTSSDCRNDHDLLLRHVCASYSESDKALYDGSFDHRFSYQSGTGRWDQFFEGSVKKLDNGACCKDNIECATEKCSYTLFSCNTCESECGIWGCA